MVCCTRIRTCPKKRGSKGETRATPARWCCSRFDHTPWLVLNRDDFGAPHTHPIARPSRTRTEVGMGEEHKATIYGFGRGCKRVSFQKVEVQTK